MPEKNVIEERAREIDDINREEAIKGEHGGSSISCIRRDER
jgi:hypothetical protein